MPARFALSVSLVPPQLWGVNLRKLLTRTEWNRIRAAAFETSPVCTACGAEAVGAARHAHEEWEYEIAPRQRTGNATLVAVRTLCRTCHFVQHPGFVGRMIAEGHLAPQILDELERHFCKVNGCGRAAYRRHLAEADARLAGYLRIQKWTMDFGEYDALVRQRLFLKTKPPATRPLSARGAGNEGACVGRSLASAKVSRWAPRLPLPRRRTAASENYRQQRRKTTARKVVNLPPVKPPNDR